MFGRLIDWLVNCLVFVFLISLFLLISIYSDLESFMESFDFILLPIFSAISFFVTIYFRFSDSSTDRSIDWLID